MKGFRNSHNPPPPSLRNGEACNEGNLGKRFRGGRSRRSRGDGPPGPGGCGTVAEREGGGVGFSWARSDWLATPSSWQGGKCPARGLEKKPRIQKVRQSGHLLRSGCVVLRPTPAENCFLPSSHFLSCISLARTGWPTAQRGARAGKSTGVAGRQQGRFFLTDCGF